MELASTELIQEHETIKVSLNVLDVISDRLESGKDIPVEDIAAHIGFLKHFVGNYHHCKEECILYPAMEESGIHNQNGPLGLVLYQHEILREYLVKMEESISAVPVKRDEFVKTARLYASLLRNNIRNENYVLLPIADIKIPPSRQEIIIKAFGEHGENSIGDETYKQLYELLEGFKRKYLM